MIHSIRRSFFSILTTDGLITNIVGTDIYYAHAPTNSGTTFIVYIQVDSIPEHHQGGDSGMARTRIQVDCYGTDPDQVETLAQAVRRVCDGFRGIKGSTFINKITLENRIDGTEGPSDGSQTRKHRSTLDFIVFHDETPMLN